MTRFLTRAEARKLDETAMKDYGIAGTVLMENAGAAVAREALSAFRETGSEKVVVICGRGNNGGDGFVAARHLLSHGIPTSVFLLCRKEDLHSPSDALTNLAILQRMAIRGFAPEVVELPTVESLSRLSDELSRRAVVIDSILGTGLTGDVREPAASGIEVLNSSGAFVISVDIPSGLDADEGVPLGEAVRADVTVTFVGEKAGFAKASARKYLGRVVVAEIGCGFLLRE